MFATLDIAVNGVSLELIVWSLFIGIMVAGAIAVYNKRFLGGFVRKLIEEEAFSPEKALTLEELGFENNKLLQREILKGVIFKSIVYEKDDEVVIQDKSAIPVFHEELDFKNARFYVPYELRHRAELKFDKKGTHIMLMVISSVFFLALALSILYFSEPFAEFINGILNG